MPKDRYMSDAQLIVAGRRYSSEDVALESRAIARWRRDVGSLAS